MQYAKCGFPADGNAGPRMIGVVWESMCGGSWLSGGGSVEKPQGMYFGGLVVVLTLQGRKWTQLIPIGVFARGVQIDDKRLVDNLLRTGFVKRSVEKLGVPQFQASITVMNVAE